ncbi:MAG: hypothetical protein RSB36_05595 [Hydrogenoanaerobacterium sp.]
MELKKPSEAAILTAGCCVSGQNKVGFAATRVLRRKPVKQPAFTLRFS